MGAGVVCSFASLAAKDTPEPAEPLLRRSRKSVARKKEEDEAERGP
jgi:hypothetical protein